MAVGLVKGEGRMLEGEEIALEREGITLERRLVEAVEVISRKAIYNLD